jgi:hypothetical protein
VPRRSLARLLIGCRPVGMTDKLAGNRGADQFPRSPTFWLVLGYTFPAPFAQRFGGQSLASGVRVQTESHEHGFGFVIERPMSTTRAGLFRRRSQGYTNRSLSNVEDIGELPRCEGMVDIDLANSCRNQI